MSYKIKALDIQARLIDQVAQVQVSQTFVNTGSRPMEVSFVFPLPYDGAIEQMTLLIDGKEYPAKLLDAKDARRMYEEIVPQKIAIRHYWSGWAQAYSKLAYFRCLPERAARYRCAIRSFAASRKA